jgi:NAD(P)-dependent dehydrogenase (short-subunit alcohol dehydrogenase family)
MGRVQGKVALVTGGASGIGQGSALLLGKEGAIVVVTDIQDDAGKDTAAAIKRAGSDAIYLRHDVTSEDAWITVMGEIKQRFGRLDILVNNAGIAITGPIVDMTLENWRRQQAINLDGVFLGVKHAIPLMTASGGGSIVNISSVAGLKGSANLAGYCATKGGVRLFTKAAAMECANADNNIRVNSIHPGLIETPIWNSIITPGGPPGANAPNLDEISKNAVPIKVKGVPHDIAEGVLFLASDASRYMTGAELVIDGGLMTK